MFDPLWTCALLLFATRAARGATLIGYAELPADTYIPGPTSNEQPVQGISALLRGSNNKKYLALSDNGFGLRGNSADYLLCYYVVRPDFRTLDGGSGRIKVTETVHLRDPDKHLPFEITRGVDRLLTGADLDPESFQMAPDGSLWVGEEFLPALLHFSGDGELLAPPFTLAGLSSEDNPTRMPPTLPLSSGFEGMAQSPDGRMLYLMPQGPLLDVDSDVNIYTFDSQEERFLNTNAQEPSFRYQLDEGATAIGAFIMYTHNEGLIIERDSEEGDAARLKKIYKVDFRHHIGDNNLVKTLVADLLDIEDPHDLDQDGDVTFRFPFWTPEGLLVIDATTIAVVNDNNYPFGAGRGLTPENTEMILLEIPPLWE